MNVHDGVVGLFVDGIQPAGTVVARARQRRDHLVGFHAAGTPHGLGPEHHAPIAVLAILADVVGFSGEPREALDSLCRFRGQRVDEGCGNDRAVVLLRAQHGVFTGRAVHGADQRHVLLADGRFELAVEAHVGIADQGGPHGIRPGRLDAAERGREVGHVQWKELDRDVPGALFADEFLQPLAGDLAVVVVGGQDVVGLGVALLDHVVDQRISSCPGTMPGRHDAVADAAFVQCVVEIQALEALHDGSDDLAR